MTPPRVLLTLSWYLPHISGLTLSADRLARDLAARGAEVTILAGQHDKALPLEEKDGALNIRRAPVWLRLGKALVMPSMWTAAWRKARDVDIVHLWLPQFDAGFVAIAARLRGRPVIATYGCSLSSPGLSGFVARLAVSASHLVAGLLARRIVVHAEDYAAQSGFCRLFRRKLDIVDLPVPAIPDTITPWRQPTPPWRIGFVGRAAREKGIGTLLAAVPHLRDRLSDPFTIALAGPGHERPPGAPAEIEIAGTLDDDAHDAFLRGLDVLILPSEDRIESYGLVQVEAMLRGVPCVTSDRPGMRQPIARTGFGRLFTPGDPVALADAITAVLTEGPPARPTPEALADIFSNARTTARYLEIYGAATG